MKVVLDVGGREFATSSETLEKSAWFRRFIEMPSEGNFIDRDPDSFAPVLEVLRTGEYPKRSDFADGASHDGYLAEMDYFGLDVPKEEEEERKRKRVDFTGWVQPKFRFEEWYIEIVDAMHGLAEDRQEEVHFGYYWWSSRTHRKIGFWGIDTSFRRMLTLTRYQQYQEWLEDSLNEDAPFPIENVIVVRKEKTLILRFEY